MPNVSLKPLATDNPPKKYRIEIDPGLQAELDLYVKAYAEEYGRRPEIADLIPAMVERFLATDREFKRFKKKQKAANPDPTNVRQTATPPKADSTTGSEATSEYPAK